MPCHFLQVACTASSGKLGWDWEWCYCTAFTNWITGCTRPTVLYPSPVGGKSYAEAAAWTCVCSSQPPHSCCFTLVRYNTLWESCARATSLRNYLRVGLGEVFVLPSHHHSNCLIENLDKLELNNVSAHCCSAVTSSCLADGQNHLQSYGSLS